MPPKPITRPIVEIRSGRSLAARRSSSTQSGIAAMISEVSPIGTFCSVTKRIEFAPGSSRPTTPAESSSDRRTLSVARPRRQAMNPSIRRPAIVKRTPAPKRPGIVSPASSIPRYVEPQTT